jgi:hypothetical protein
MICCDKGLSSTTVSTIFGGPRDEGAPRQGPGEEQSAELWRSGREDGFMVTEEGDLWLFEGEGDRRSRAGIFVGLSLELSAGCF